MAPSSKCSKLRPSEVASDTKKNFIPHIRNHYADTWPSHSVLYSAPTQQLPLTRHSLSTRPPAFRIEIGDPVEKAMYYGIRESQASEAEGGPRIRIPFLCAANERRPGGDWETGCSGYEEKLCRRSNLSATLSTPDPRGYESSHYPIPSDGGILSDAVVVYRGPHDHYEKLDHWVDLPVISVPPTRWPKLKDYGTKYSFAEEREMIAEKIRGALRICLYNGYDRIVIGDFGLGNGYRNPPQELAEIWRDIFLFDPAIRGQFAYVIFVFEDPSQSTTKAILDETARKESKSKSKSSSSSSSRHKSHGSSSSSGSGSSRSSSGMPTDLDIFQHVFAPSEIQRVVSEPDPRYGLAMITC